MNWYLAKIVFQIICGNGHHQPQFDEQLRLIAAGDEQQAYEKARNIGIFEQDAFYNSANKLVEWKFIGVPEVIQLALQSDGAEVFARVQEPEDATSYIETVIRKSVELEKKDPVLMF